MFASARDLGVAARLVAFALGLLVVGILAALAGAATGDRREPAAKDGADMAMEEMSSAEQSRASGLVSATAGYTFAPERTTLPRGETTPFRFRILDEHGDPVRDVDVDGGVRVHLIVVRRDFSGYQHLHPKLGADGSWVVPLQLRAPGVYRAFADFEIDGEKTVLGHDLFVPGRFAPTPLPPAGASATAGGVRGRPQPRPAPRERRHEAPLRDQPQRTACPVLRLLCRASRPPRGAPRR